MATVTADDVGRYAAKKADLEINSLFRALVKNKGSDLHLKVGRAPIVRVNGALRDLPRGPMTDEEMVQKCFPMLTERNRRIFDETGGADFPHTVDVDGTQWRFRVNLFQQLGHVGMVARKVNQWI